MPVRPTRPALRSPRRLAALLLLLGAPVAGCRDDADLAGRFRPPPDLSTAGATATALTFSQISAGNVHSCGVAAGGTGVLLGPQQLRRAG